jgi:RNA polymerase sigma factor (sigma-70 family)
VRTDQPAGADEMQERFVRAFRELSPRVFAYARRHCALEEAQDVVSDTFLVAWRRWADVPDNALPWLLVAARNTIANGRRGAIRRDRLANQVSHLEAVAGSAPGADHDVVERDTVITALGRLTDLEREAVLLVAWDGLSRTEAAQVAGCSARAFEVRLSRARSRLAREMDGYPATNEPLSRFPAANANEGY